jgi:hypothetical protein
MLPAAVGVEVGFGHPVEGVDGQTTDADEPVGEDDDGGLVGVAGPGGPILPRLIGEPLLQIIPAQIGEALPVQVIGEPADVSLGVLAVGRRPGQGTDIRVDLLDDRRGGVVGGRQLTGCDDAGLDPFRLTFQASENLPGGALVPALAHVWGGAT